MKKITVNKSDEVAVIVEKIIEAADDEVVLVIPRFSHIGESLSNFHLLKREAEALDKKIIIESVDDHVIELAGMSGLSALNPFFTKNKRQFSDIVSPKAAKSRHRRLQVVQEADGLESEGPRQMSRDLDFGLSIESPQRRWPRVNLNWVRIPKISLRVPRPGVKSAWLFLLLAVLGLTGWAGAEVLPRASVIIIAQTQDWAYNDSIITDKSAVVDVAKMRMPNQVFSQKKNAQLKFPATGRRQVERKATGMMTIYNSYSSDPQPLVEQTRFMAPDGKIFRLTKSITVPGAKIVEGRIVPSSIAAEVVADEPGPAYNIGPVKLFTIPGFSGSPKYQSFYGESKNSMAGGFIGEVAYPTDDDIKKAKESARVSVEEDLKATLLSQIPKEFKILEDASQFKMLTQEIDEVTDPEGKFGVFTEAQMTTIAFKEEDLKNLLGLRAKRENGDDFDVRSSTLEYGLARADFENGILTFPAKFQSVLARRIDKEMLKENILGKSEADLKLTVFSLPGLKSATISLWPFYVSTVPTDPDKVKIIVE
jgi:hypothetical protein